MWWLVTPGNPLKDTAGLPPLADRIAAARALAHHPRIDVTGIEAAIGTRYTLDTHRRLVRRCPGVRFVWIMGADNLGSFHRWQRWRGIARLVPIAVVDRGGHRAPSPRRPPSPWRAGACPRRRPSRLPRHRAAGLGVPARAEVAAVLDRAAAAGGAARPGRMTPIDTAGGNTVFCVRADWSARQ